MPWTSRRFLRAAPVPIVVDCIYPFWALFPTWALFVWNATHEDTIGNKAIWRGLN